MRFIDRRIINGQVSRSVREPLLRTALGVAAFFLVLVSLPACAPTHEPDLRVGVLVWPPYEMAYLAEHLGYFEGAPIDLIEFHAPAEVSNVYASGGIDALALTSHYLLQLRANDPEHKAIMLIDYSDGGDALLARPDIGSLSELKGRRIGVERGPLGVYMLRRALDKGGLSYNDVSVVSMDVHTSPNAYESGTVDAVITYEPFRTKVLDMGANEIFTSNDIPKEIVDVLVAGSDTIEEREKAIQTLVDGWLRAVEYFEENPQEAAEVMRQRTGMSADAFLRAIEGAELTGREENRRVFRDGHESLNKTFARQARIMAEAGLISDASRIEGDLCDARFVLGVED